MSLTGLQALARVEQKKGGKCRKCAGRPHKPLLPLQRPLALKDSRAFNAIVPVYNFSPLGPHTLNQSPPHLGSHKGKPGSQIRDLKLPASHLLCPRHTDPARPPSPVVPPVCT